MMAFIRADDDRGFVLGHAGGVCVEEGRVMMRDRGREEGTEREGSTDDFGRQKSAWEQERLVCREREGASGFGRL